MPRPTLPPTPASSTDIAGKDGVQDLAALQLAFELPPPALIQDSSRISPTDPRVSPKSTHPVPSAKSDFPMQAAEAVKSRRRASSSTQKASSNDPFALPPPPTRSRKIIQMKPRPSNQDEQTESSAAAPSDSGTGSSSTKTASGAGAKAAASTSKDAATKKKQPSATSAAGRKIARKTAHSLIERRRRSKMNEEFAVLKDMIPACTGEMHKLAILQASIEYVRYLEDCVEQLKAQRDIPEAAPTDSGQHTPSGRWASIPQFHPSYQQDASDDVEMTGSEAASPTFTAQPSHSHQPSVSPAILPEEARRRHDSYSSASTDHRHYSYSSATTSPAFGPQSYGGYGHGLGAPSLPASALTSPALAPLREHRDLDQEATAALLMLNSDRRGSMLGGHPGHGSDRSNSTASNPGGTQSAPGVGRGMSVRDLLSA